ncbi:amidophosphoribosyltransferase [Malassezia vespertilionis]|uniref:Amidophosphoribosyltransferase n=1 Tax=Malassezia vespertilionis TaxID=2020962 RepID=A0A2N1JGK6_9BASI|nr:amidophosphoribosyltransferase [Malassezia vespertilionis]PKI85665.1 Ade4p [Malassezia vespertilionis]WFD04688.1 amidophosphoribosyltransferase [Malassezia vespertilionis]
MVRDVFELPNLASLRGSMGVGHVRYPTAGSFAHSEAQPFYVNSPYGIVFAHNGNTVNQAELRKMLDGECHRHVNTDSDSELLLNLFASYLQETGKFRVNEEDIFTAIKKLMGKVVGAYACVAMIAGFGIIAFRDPHGIRPLGMCSRRSQHASRGGDDKDICFASESVVGDALDYTDFEDVRPGEAIIVTRSNITRKKLVATSSADAFTPDIFEYVYFARPDSVIDGVSVYRSRMAMGERLARTVSSELLEKGVKIDVVIPVPDTSRVAALQVAQNLGIHYREGFVKNRYVGRTFIMPGQSVRRKNVRRKLNAMALEFNDKNVLLVDDSIVRGTTSREIIQMAREAGAKKVFIASCAPPIRFSNVFGIDMPSRNELVAHNRTIDEIAQVIQADAVIYQTLEDLIDSIQSLNPALTRFDCSIFDGHYVTGGVDEKYLHHLEELRAENDQVKKTTQAAEVSASAQPEAPVSCSGPMNGAEDIGLYNGRTR